MKTMAIRLDDELHAQLTVLAQLSNGSIAEVIRAAIDAYVEAKRHDPTLAAQADSVLADIDAAARNRRDAIATLFTNDSRSADTSTEPAEPTTSRRGTRRTRS